MLHRIVVFFNFLIVPLLLLAENASNVRVHQRNKDIVITYDLSKTSDVRVFISQGSEDTFVLLKATEGAVGKHIQPGKNLEVIWHPLDEEDSFIAENVRFKVEALTPYEWYALPKSHNRVIQGGKTNIETFILVDIAYATTPQMSYGLTLGQTYSGLGWFVEAHSNFRFESATNEMVCGEGGYIGNELPFYSGHKKSSILVVNAGVVVDFLEWTNLSPRNRFNTLGVYLGAGYGSRYILWETLNGDLIKFNPNSYQGFSTNIGVIGSVYGLICKVGVNTISFKYLELEAGIGWIF